MTSTLITERKGINAVERLLLENSWIFREQTVGDWGIDAQAEPTNNGKPLGKLVALQIKTGKSYFARKGDGFVYRGNRRHLDYWLQHSLPVYIIIHDPDEDITLWQKIEQHLISQRNGDRWTIPIPKSNIFNTKALVHIKRNTASDPNSFRRYFMALDLSLMKKFFGKIAFMDVMEFYNKSFKMRGAEVWFTKRNKPIPDLSISRMLPCSGIHEYMAELFPWLTYKHTTPLLYPYGDAEGEVHHLKVELNELGLAFLKMETYYKDGPARLDYEIPYDTSDELDEDEQMDADWERAMNK